MLHVTTMDHTAVPQGTISPDRTVMPRTHIHGRLPVIALCRKTDENGNVRHETLTEDGELGLIADLIPTLRTRKPTMFVTHWSADLLGDLDKHFADRYPLEWQWRVTNGEKPVMAPSGAHVVTNVTVVTQWFGFKNHGFHKLLDPVVMYAKSIDGIWEGDEQEIVKLMQWGVALRDFCIDSNLEIRPTMGAVSTQFLTDKRFYPHARRKIPRATNDNIREHQGNFYYLGVRPDPHKSYNAYYLDQRRAHHYHAHATEFPNADSLYATGDFQHKKRICFGNTFSGFYGLYCLDLDVPSYRRTSPYVRDWLRHGTRDKVLTGRYVFSNEIEFLKDMGYRVRGVRAAWGSRKLDTGLAKYATWAEEQLDRHNDVPWLKPILLSTYGALASRPKIVEMIHKIAKKGDVVTLNVGRNKLTGIRAQGVYKLEPRTANVLHRGMIDAAQRIESVAYAHYLDMAGYRVLSVNADAVMVEVDEDKDVPLLIDPWRLKGILSHYQPLNPQGFMSDQVTKIPGVSGVGRDLLRYQQATPGTAPRITHKYEALTGRLMRVDTRTGEEVY